MNSNTTLSILKKGSNNILIFLGMETNGEYTEQGFDLLVAPYTKFLEFSPPSPTLPLPALLLPVNNTTVHCLPNTVISFSVGR